MDNIKPLTGDDESDKKSSVGESYDVTAEAGLSKAENKNGLLSALGNEILIDSSAPKADIISTPSTDSRNPRGGKSTHSLDTAKLGRLKTISEPSAESTDSQKKEVTKSKSGSESSLSDYVDDILTVKTGTAKYSVASIKEKMDLEQKLRKKQLENHKQLEKYEKSKYSISSLTAKVAEKLVGKKKHVGVKTLPFEKSADYRAIKTVEILNKTYSNIRIETDHLPDLIELVESKINIEKGSVAVVSCGPESMKNDVKRGFLNKLHKKNDDLYLDFFEEELAW